MSSSDSEAKDYISEPLSDDNGHYLTLDEAINIHAKLVERCQERCFPFLNKPLHKITPFSRG